ncbi:hypothetical protein G6F56_006218 [Rhizopus delemar]|nr:hypothetical protein G6F56_006218 [Rhizopus delemar]
MSLTSILAVAKTKQTATVFWFHGLGDSGSGWQFLADELASIFPHVKWIFPNAPIRKMSINGGCSLPAWFDISGADKLDPKTEDSKGMLASVSSGK